MKLRKKHGIYTSTFCFYFIIYHHGFSETLKMMKEVNVKLVKVEEEIDRKLVKLEEKLIRSEEEIGGKFSGLERVVVDTR